MKGIKKIALLLSIILWISCSKDQYLFDPEVSGCDLSQTTYENGIKSIIDENCSYAGCHASNTGDNNFDFTTYDGVKKGIGSILNRIDRPLEDPLHMPQGRLLDPCDKEKMHAWITKGAPLN